MSNKQNKLDIGAVYLDRDKAYFVEVTGVQDYEDYTIVDIIYPGLGIRKSMTSATFDAGYKFVVEGRVDITSAIGRTV